MLCFMERLRATTSINYYCRPSKKGKDGLSPVEMGVNVNGTRFFVNLPRRSNPSSFQREMLKRTPTPLKEYLLAVETSIRSYETKCLSKGKRIGADDMREFIRNGFYSPTENLGYLIDRFYEYVDGKDVAPCVKKKYRLVVNNFLASSGLTRESGIEEISAGKCRDFVEYLTRKYKNSSLSGMVCRFKALLTYGVENNLLDRNPMYGIKVKKQEVKIETITYEEYERLKALDLSWCERLEKVRDLFCFSCGTGLAYTDTQNLSAADFKTNNEGQVYLSKERAKTGVLFTLVVLPDALAIARKYDYNLPKISNQKMNSYLKELQDLARIKTTLTCHKSRHFYARTLLNKYHFSLDIVARCLGHSNTNISRHYAKLFSSTVFDAFKEIGEGL